MSPSGFVVGLRITEDLLGGGGSSFLFGVSGLISINTTYKNSTLSDAIYTTCVSYFIAYFLFESFLIFNELISILSKFNRHRGKISMCSKIVIQIPTNSYKYRCLALETVRFIWVEWFSTHPQVPPGLARWLTWVEMVWTAFWERVVVSFLVYLCGVFVTFLKAESLIKLQNSIELHVY